MGVNKVIMNNSDGTQNTIVDLTEDTVSADKLVEGATAHGANGDIVTGTIARAPIEITGTASENNVYISDGSLYLNASPDLSADRMYIDNGQHKIMVGAAASSLGDATAYDVAAGVTFTSENGVKIVGTNPAGKWATAYNMSAAHSMTKSAEKISLSQIVGSGNHGFKLVSGGLQCPYNGTVIVTGVIMLGTGYTANDQIHVRAYRNSSATGPDIVHRKVSTSNGTVQINTIVSVAAGDMIYLYAYNQTAARGTVQANATTRITAAYIG